MVGLEVFLAILPLVALSAFPAARIANLARYSRRGAKVFLVEAAPAARPRAALAAMGPPMEK
jgi:hypothetical protein